MDEDDDCYAECGFCGHQLPPLTPWKSNPCENPACPSFFSNLLADLWNLSNDIENERHQQRLRAIHRDLLNVLRTMPVDDSGLV